MPLAFRLILGIGLTIVTAPFSNLMYWLEQKKKAKASTPASLIKEMAKAMPVKPNPLNDQEALRLLTIIKDLKKELEHDHADLVMIRTIAYNPFMTDENRLGAIKSIVYPPRTYRVHPSRNCGTCRHQAENVESARLACMGCQSGWRDKWEPIAQTTKEI